MLIWLPRTRLLRLWIYTPISQYHERERKRWSHQSECGAAGRRRWKNRSRVNKSCAASIAIFISLGHHERETAAVNTNYAPPRDVYLFKAQRNWREYAPLWPLARRYSFCKKRSETLWKREFKRLNPNYSTPTPLHWLFWSAFQPQLL